MCELSVDHLDLHGRPLSFPTRRSSYLIALQLFLQPLAGFRIELGAVARRRSGAQREWLPVILEISEHGGHFDRPGFDLCQAGATHKVDQPVPGAERKPLVLRSEERRVGKECVSTGDALVSPYH